MFLRVPLLALACALPYSLISATPLPTDNSLITCAGSSGSLNHPAGGFTLTSDPGKGTSYLEVSYNQPRSPDLRHRPCPRTPLRQPLAPILIPKGLAQLDGSLSDPIKTRFETGTACREFRLVVTEYQY